MIVHYPLLTRAVLILYSLLTLEKQNSSFVGLYDTTPAVKIPYSDAALLHSEDA